MEKLNSDSNSGRLEYLDIAKGIGILLVVWSHAKGPYGNYFYQFHMPLFFLISGFLFNGKNSPKQFIVRKITSLYIPFVFWNVFFMFFRLFTGIDSFRGKSFWIKIKNILLTLDKDGVFMGATWFLGSLFVVSICYKLLDYYIEDVKGKSIFLAAVFGAMALVGFSITLPYMLSRTLILSFFFAVGRVVRDYKGYLSNYDGLTMFLFSLAAFAVIGHYNSANMGGNQYRYPMLFVIGAIFASYAVVYVSRLLENKTTFLKKIFAVMGRKSLPIVIWHLVVFRAVIAVQLLRWGEPLTRIEEFYSNIITGKGWWIIFIVVGISGSMIIGEIISKVKMLFRRKR